MKRRILALLLTFLMLVSAFPLTLFTAFAEESGTETEIEEGEVVTLYENDFSDSTKTADSKGSAASIADGVLTFGNWGDNHWTKNITLNNSTGLITISFKMQPNLQKEYDLLSVNGVVLLSAAASAIKIGDSSQTATIGYNSADVVRAVTVTIDPATGDATVSYSHPTNSSHADNFSGTVNVGTVSGSLALTLGATVNGNGWTADDLVVTQEAVAAHTCNYVKNETLSSDATCTVPEIYVEECTICGEMSSRTVVSPALGHDWTEYEVEDGYQTRSCNTCGHTETKKVGKIINTMPLLALGDSITFGTGVNNNPQNSWAKYVADELELDYVNIARAGTALYAWYCVLTGDTAPNGNMYYIGGWDQESLTQEVKEASIIVFTLYTNDILVGGGWRPADKIVECLVDFVDAIHEINPEAIIVPVGYAYGEAFWPGNQYGQYESELATVNELCIETFNTGDYNDYVYYVDCTDIFSDHASFIRDYNSDPDGVHPGTQGNIAMAASVMSALGYTATGDPDTLYDITFKDGEEVVLEDSYYGMYLLPEALTKDGKVFGGWSDGNSIFVENTEVLVIGDTTFTAVWYDTAESSFNISEIMDTVEGAFVSGDLSSSQVYDAETGILTAAREGRYSFSLQKGVVYDGKTTLALTSTNTYTNTGSSNTDGIGVTLPAESPVLVKNGRYVALTYYYAPVSATTNVGRSMDLYVTTESKTFSARSMNTTVANGWATVYFDLATGANVADMAEETITSIAIRWYDGTFVSTTNDAYYFDSVSFTNVSPFYTVKYQDDGVNLTEPVSVLGQVTLPAFAKDGYKLTGWTDGENTYNIGQLVTLVGDTTFTAIWTEKQAVTTVNYSETFDSAATVIRDYYRGISPSYDDTTGIASISRSNNYEIQAKFAELDGINTIQVTSAYNVPGGWNGPALTLIQDTGLTLGESKYVSVQYYYNGTTLAGQTMTLYVKVGNTFIYAVSDETIVSNEWATITFDLSTHASFETYKDTLVGEVDLYFYTTHKNEAARAYSTSYNFPTNHSFYFGAFSYSEEDTATNISATFYDEAQESVIEEITNRTGRFTVPDCDVVKEGYVFVGWKEVGDDSDTVYLAGDIITLTENTSFYAVYEGAVNYTATFVTPDETIAPITTQTGAITLPTPASREEGYIFYGWSDGVDTYAAGATINISGDTAFTAVWKESVVLHEHAAMDWWTSSTHTVQLLNTTDPVTIDFGIQVGTLGESDILIINGVTVVRTDANRKAYVGEEAESSLTFDQWSTSTIKITITDLSTGEATVYIYSKGATYTTTVTLGAIGDTITLTGTSKSNNSSDTISQLVDATERYTVTYMDGMTELGTETVHDSVVLPDLDLADEHKILVGWTDGTTDYAIGETVTITGDTTFTAIVETVYIATFTGDGVEESTQRANAEGQITLIAAPVRDGYEFLGWSDGTSLYAAGQTVLLVADTEFVASWYFEEEHSYTNLQNMHYKLENDGELTVGWITDSIGWGQNGNESGIVNGVNYASAFAGGTKNPMSFTRVVTDWLEWYAKENYEIDSADIDVFYSTYGGATHQRELGYLRDDLLAYCPDVIFIETWNGTNVDSDSAYDARVASKIYMESIVQQIYAINPYCDIVLVNPGGNGAGYAFSAIRDQYNLIEIQVAAATSAYFGNQEIFGDETANATIYYGGGIHINEEAYAFYSKLITAELEEQLEAVSESGLDTYVPTQPASMRITTDGQDNIILPTDTLYSADMLYLTSGRVDANELTYDANWTLTDGEVDVTAPLDSAEKTGKKKITATADGATVTYTLNGAGFIINGSGSYTVSIDGVEKGTYSGETVYIRCTPDDADGTYAITITAANGASISDVYVYAHAYTPIETYENVKERYVVSYYARIADEYIHNQQKNGYDILPKYLTWINLQREELFGTDASATVPGGSILANKIEKNGTFVGWVEADSYYFFEGEKFPVINAYKYEDGKIIDLTTDEEKTLYVEGGVITPARDMTLVAVYSGGYDGDETKHVVNFISDGETLKTVNTTAQITMIAAPVKAGYIFRGWSDGQGNTFAVGNIVRVAGDTNFTAKWEAITPDADGTVRLNISDDILFSTQGALGSSATYDSENDTTTYSNGTRYTYTLFRDQAKDGVNTIKLVNDSYSFTGYEGAKITLPGISVQIQDTPYISLAYFYERTAGKNSQVGAYMTLGIKTSGGSTFYVSSDEAVIADEWHTLVFCLENAYVYNKAAYDVSANAEETISEIYIYWYDFNGREGGFKDFAENSYSFSTIAFSSVDPIYTASFESDGAQAYEPVDTKGSIILPEALTKVGYNFIGWTSDGGETVHEAGDTVFVSADTTFVAVWEEYKMSFVDGTTVLETIYTTGTFTAPECTISKLNNTFVGWTNDGGTTVYEEGDTIIVTGDTTFTAIWVGNFTAIFVDGDTTVETLANVTNIFIPEFAELSKDGYVLAGWKADGDDTVYTAGQEVILDSDTTFEAVWIKLHTVTIMDGETEVTTATTTDEYTLPATLDKEHYTLIGWSDGTTTYAPGATVTVTADTTFSAVWETAEYTVTFKNGETTVYTTTATVADSITVPAAYAKEGYVFKGYSDGNATYAAGSTVTVVGDTTFDAVYITFEENIPETNNLSDLMTTTNGMLSGFGVYEYDETNDVYTGTVTDRYTYTLSRNVTFDAKTALVLENTSYSVTGWQNSVILLPDLEKTAGEAKNISIDYYYAPISNFNNVGRYMVLRLTANNQTYYVYSEETIVRDTWATVTFNCANAKLNGSSFDISTIESYDITKAELFWYDTDTQEGKTGSFRANAGDKLYFTDISFANNTSVSDYTVTFMNGEDKYAAAETNGSVVLPELEAVFAWSDGVNLYSEGVLMFLEDDITLTAVTEPVYTATFTGEGVTAGMKLTTGEITLPEASEREGFEFLGWSDGTTTYAAGATVTLVDDTTFTAVWEELVYVDVSFYDGDTLISGPTSVYEIVTMPEALTPDNDYAIFAGWSDGTNTYAAGETVNVSENTIFTAVWKESVLIHETSTGSYWWNNSTHSIELLNSTDTVIVELYFATARTGAANVLKINGITVITKDADQKAYVGEESDSHITLDQWQASLIRVTITDLSTGEATVYINTKSGSYTTSIVLGEIGGTITLNGDSSLGAVTEYDKVYQLIDVRPRYNVTYTDGETELGTEVSLGSVVLPDFELADTHQIILGWTDGENTYAIGDTVTVTDDITFTAIIETVYTATFTGDGIDESTQKTDSEGQVTLITPPARDGYEFLGWSDGTTTYAAGDVLTLADDTTFTAVWEQLVYADVSFYDGETLISGPTTVLGYVTMPAALTSDNDYAIFLGWSNGEKIYFPGDTVKLTEDTAFTAVWKESIVLHECALKQWWTSYTHMADLLNTTDPVVIDFYIENFGNISGASNILTVNGVVVVRMDESRNAYVGEETESHLAFGQWKSATIKVTITDLSTGEATVYINADGRSYTTTMTLGEIGSSVRISGTSKANNSSDKISQLVDIRERYTVTYTDGETELGTETALDSVVLPSFDISDENKTLIGWTDGENIYAIGDTVTIAGDTTFTAVWQITPAIVHSASFHNNLTLNYYVDAAALEGYENIRLAVEKDEYNGGVKSTSTVTLYGTLTDEGYKFVYSGIAAAEAGDELRATVYADKNGKTYASEQDVYSIKEYAYNRLAATENELFKTLLVDMLNYCAASQMYFEYRTDALVNADLTNEQKAYGTQTDAAVSSTINVTTLEGATASVYAVSAVFNSNVELKFYLNLSKYDDISGISFKVVYNEKETVITSDKFVYDEATGCYTVKYSNIPAAELRNLMDVTIMSGEEAISGTVTYSIETYVNSRLQNSTNETFKTLLRELMKYSDSAKAYFAN